MDDANFLRQFEECIWPLNQWHHRQHVKVAYLYLRQYPLAAVDPIGQNIKRFNAAHHVPEAMDRGYHETLTQAWMHFMRRLSIRTGRKRGRIL